MKYKKALLIQRIRTSLWLPKLILGATIGVIALDIVFIYGLFIAEPTEIINEASKLIDSSNTGDHITATVIKNG